MDLDRLIEFAQQNLLPSLALAGLTVALLVTEVMRLFRRFKVVSPAQATELINRENAVVIDLRGQADFEKGHLTGARHLPLSQLEPGARALPADKDTPVVLVCAAGVSAQGAAQKLAKAGHTRVSVLDGGIGGWQSAGLPLARGKA